VTFDSWLPVYRQNDNAFDIPMTTAVQVNGTLDNRKDEDQGWTAELKIPLEAARGRLPEMKNVPPQVGTEWRANFFRMDMPAGKPQQASAWSPPMVGDFHALNKFGTLVFADETGVAPTTGSVPLMAPVLQVGGPNGPHPISPMTRRMMMARPAGAGKVPGTVTPPGMVATPGTTPAATPDKGQAKP
jgi:hypothetical protein